MFIDARKLGTMVDRVRRDFNTEDTLKISDTYHAWRGQSDAIERHGEYKDVSGFCYSGSLEDIKKNGYVLTPSRFVGAEDELDENVPFEEKFESISMKLNQYFQKGQEIQSKIESSLNLIQVDKK